MNDREIAEEIVVFLDPSGKPFSNDARWNDSRVREAWKALQNNQPLEEDDDEDDFPPYEQWNNDDLRAELVTRGLSVDGKKVDMVKRLEQDDAKAEA